MSYLRWLLGVRLATPRFQRSGLPHVYSYCPNCASVMMGGEGHWVFCVFPSRLATRATRDLRFVLPCLRDMLP